MMKPIYHFSISLMLWAFGRNDGGEACSRFPEETNVALTGYATQSSDYPGTPAGPAINAIDGKRNSEYYTGKSCTHTNFQSSPWWRVDLQTSYLISAITVTARGDCCTSRLEGAEIHVGNSLKNNGIDNPLCAKITGITSAAPQTFCCNGMEGKYVTIVIPGRTEWLTLCEVEVYAVSSCKNEIKGTNIALKGYATQSSDYKVDPPGPPQNAIDGKKSTDYYTGKSCTHTDLESSPWWRVDLLQSYQISEVIVTGRGDCCASRLEGAEIRVGNSLKNNGINNALCGKVTAITSSDPLTFCCNGMEARYVTIVIPDKSEWLTLCEVEVYGEPTRSSELTETNIALKGHATQSSDYQGTPVGPPENAIDGNRNSHYYNSLSCTHTNWQSSPWWSLDLLQSYLISSVIITGRGDCCASRLEGAEIHVGNSAANNGINNPLCATITGIKSADPRTFQCNGMEGRYITIAIPARTEFLTLCEVEVFGVPAIKNDIPDSVLG